MRCFGPLMALSVHSGLHCTCPLLTQSGHSGHTAFFLVVGARERVSSAFVEFAYPMAVDALLIDFQHRPEQ
jgi:hypothetical protein